MHKNLVDEMKYLITTNSNCKKIYKYLIVSN